LLPKLLLLLHQQTGAGQHGPSDWLSSSTANKSFQLCAPEGGSLSSSPADGPLGARTRWGAEAQKNIWQNYKSLKSRSNARLYTHTLVAYTPVSPTSRRRHTSQHFASSGLRDQAASDLGRQQIHLPTSPDSRDTHDQHGRLASQRILVLREPSSRPDHRGPSFALPPFRRTVPQRCRRPGI
jgi:hypothetical protein